MRILVLGPLQSVALQEVLEAVQRLALAGQQSFSSSFSLGRTLHPDPIGVLDDNLESATTVRFLSMPSPSQVSRWRYVVDAKVTPRTFCL